MKNQLSVNKMILVSLKHNNINREYGFSVSWNDSCVMVGSIILKTVADAIRLNKHIEESYYIESL